MVANERVCRIHTYTHSIRIRLFWSASRHFFHFVFFFASFLLSAPLLCVCPFRIFREFRELKMWLEYIHQAHISMTNMITTANQARTQILKSASCVVFSSCPSFLNLKFLVLNRKYDCFGKFPLHAFRVAAIKSKNKNYLPADRTSFMASFKNESYSTEREFS